MMKKLGFRIFLMSLLAALSLWGQTSATISSVRIYTTPNGARFYVDGQIYVTSQTFLWAEGSKHVVQFPLDMENGVPLSYQTSVDRLVRYTFGGWVDNAGLLIPGSDPVQVVTASPKLTSISTTAAVQYLVRLRFSTNPTAPVGCGGAPGNPVQDANRAGLVYIGGQCFGSDSESFMSAGALSLNAFPYPGWVFTGWNVNGTIYLPYLASINITGPTTINPIFALGHRVQFLTEPFGFKLLIDRTQTPTSTWTLLDDISAQSKATPCTTGVALPPNPPVGFTGLCLGQFDFLPGSQHIIAAVTPQYDQQSVMWVFDSFSNGQSQNSVLTVPNNVSQSDVITAKFVRGVSVAFLTQPLGLKLQIDGSAAWQSYNFAWATGSQHTVTAPASQVDSNGRTWTFQSWSNGGQATQTVTADATNPRFTAVYSALGQVKITTSPSGIKLQVDGVDCTTPCTVDKASGTTVSIVAPASIPQDATSRLDFQGWTDGAVGTTRQFTFDGNAKTISGSYATTYRLSLGSDPADGVDFTVDPPSTDFYYPSDSTVSISAKARPGFKFRRWNGDAAGVYPAASVKMAGPQTLVAMLDKVPYIAPAGIRNAAGDTFDGSVAPGSIIAIFGQSLAPRTEVGPTSPLAQTIADTVVLVSDRILPLLFVSPTQINAQVTSDLADGTYTLKVQTKGQPDVTGTFTVSRNAPGLFTRSNDTLTYSMASHEDGTPVTPDSPARRGETISLFGTGFGPYDQKVIDGFIVPDPSNYKVLDPVEVDAGETVLQPVWAGAAPGFVGTTLTKLKIDDSLPASTNVELTVKVNGKPSNKVVVPVE